MQFGSTGKGLLASHLATNHHIDMAVSNLSPNAGHTFDSNGKLLVSKQIPISCLINKRCGCYLTAGSIIDLDLLLQEKELFEISDDQIMIHPEASIITTQDKEKEKSQGSSVKKIASTMSGTGVALSNKILRSAKLAKDIPELQKFIYNYDLDFLLRNGCTLLFESCQGFDLSINSGFYPHTTSRDITVSSILNDSQLHPSYLGDVYGCMRTFPIRVGNIIESGHEIGYSGPFHRDSDEITWKELGVPEEYTTNTKRIRRIATFSKLQYQRALRILKPDYVFLNFCNYNFKNKRKARKYSNELKRVLYETKWPDLFGYGPYNNDIVPELIY